MLLSVLVLAACSRTGVDAWSEADAGALLRIGQIEDGTEPPIDDSTTEVGPLGPSRPPNDEPPQVIPSLPGTESPAPMGSVSPGPGSPQPSTCREPDLTLCRNAPPGSLVCDGLDAVVCFTDPAGCPAILDRASNHEYCSEIVPDCANGRDTNGDGALDCAPPACSDADCDDRDCAQHPDCIEEICDNGVDDDGDGAVDCSDVECEGSTDCEEDCADGIDNDGDGALDCADPVCRGSSDCAVCTEAESSLGSEVGAAIATGSTVGMGNDLTSACSATAASDVMFSWVPPTSGCYELDTLGSNYDTVLHLRGPCPDREELACDDDTFSLLSRIRTVVEADTEYLIVVDGFDTSSGRYVLNVQACSENCYDNEDNDLDGLVDCDDPDCASLPSCSAEICDNQLDDDGDGDADCADADCRGEPMCQEQCDDGIDNDLDQRVDCDDGDCAMDPACFVCPEIDVNLESTVAVGMVTGTTEGAGDDAFASCGASSRSEDVVFAWTPPVAGCYRFDTTGSDYDTTLHIHSECPAFTELACNDDDGVDQASSIELEVTVGTTYIIVVDGYDSFSSGEYVLNIQPCP